MGPRAGRPSPPTRSLLPSAGGRVSSGDSESPDKAVLFTRAAYRGQGAGRRSLDQQIVRARVHAFPLAQHLTQGYCPIRNVHPIVNVQRIRTLRTGDPDNILHTGLLKADGDE